ncbi:MAG: indole-3-glycerol phosphate synthase TrpC [Bacillota bacterium]
MFLENVLAEQRERVRRQKERVPLSSLIESARIRSVRLNFSEAIKREGLSLIAEVKRGSPSKGLLAPDLDPGTLAALYQLGGARAISVLTEPRYFYGSASDLQAARRTVQLPVLRKDFLIEPYQIWEAAAWGADAVLLIIAALSPSSAGEMLECCREAGVEALIEVHGEEELERAMRLKPRIIGINTRNLLTLQVEKKNLARIRPLIPEGILTIAESGINSSHDLRRIKTLGFHGALIGEALVKSADPALTLYTWLKEVEHDQCQDLRHYQ